MMRRCIYSKDPKHAPPLIEVYWDRTMLLMEAKAGTLDIKSIGPMFQKAMSEITEAIKQGKLNAQKSNGGKEGAGEGTAKADSPVEPG